MTNHIDLATIKLDLGGHTEARAKKGEACLMELVAIFAGVPYSDHPSCTSPVLGAFGRALNDGLDDERRQRLVPFIPRLVDTAGDPTADQIRAWMATDWLVRTFAPIWLHKAGLTDRADELAGLPELTSTELAQRAQPVIEQARAAAKDAGATWAEDAAWAAVDAAEDAAWAAGGAAWAAGDAAGAAAWAVGAAGDAETTAELLESALALFGRMCNVRSAVPA